MKRISQIGNHLKKIYRIYNLELLQRLQEKGFLDLRPSFLEVLLFICEEGGPTIKAVGLACGLKKQTMTSHLNELEERGYIIRKKSETDLREQNVFLTEYGQKFKVNLFECVTELENNYIEVLGEVELDRIDHILKKFYEKIHP